MIIKDANDFNTAKVMMTFTMKQLGVVQFFTWFALFSMWVFTTDAVATHIYGLTGDYSKSVEYNTAGNAVSSAFGVCNFVAAGYALLLPLFAKWLGKKGTHAFSLIRNLYLLYYQTLITRLVSLKISIA